MKLGLPKRAAFDCAFPNFPHHPLARISTGCLFALFSVLGSGGSRIRGLLEFSILHGIMYSLKANPAK
jgi:hypothetical protein